VKTKVLWTLSSAALVLSCGADGGLENADSTALALSRTCASSPANANFVKGYAYASAQTYSQTNCFKGVVVDVSAYMQTLTPGGGATGTGTPAPSGVGGINAGLPTEVGATRIAWADAVPTTQTECESIVLGAYLFEGQSAPGAWTTQEFQSEFGHWNGSSCTPPFVDYSHAEMLTGNKYRIAAGARRENTTSAPTRRLTVATRTQ
jgi:hypothetical protein